jgi:hypothetical protein
LDALEVAEAVLRAAGPGLGELLEKTGSDVADAASERLAESAAAAGAAGFGVLWRRLRRRAGASNRGEALSEAAAAVAADPHDTRSRALLVREVAQVLCEDSDLLEDAARWSGADGGAEVPAGDVAGPRAVQARDVAHSTIVTGDGNRIG